MKKFLSVGAVVVLLPLLSACGESVEVPPAYVGKLSTKDGLQAGIITPSKLRLSSLCFTCDSLILVEASDLGIKEEMEIYMPQDRLNLTVEVRGTVTISKDEKNVSRIFDRLTSKPLEGNSRVRVISINDTYAAYAQPVIREVVRSVVTKYSIAQVMENRDTVSAELTQALRTALTDSPIQTIRFGLADVQPPEVILNSETARKQREIDVQKAEADKLVRLTEAQADYEVAVKRQEIDLIEAETQVLVNLKLSEGVNPAFIAQRGLKVLELLATSGNHLIILPQEAFNNPALLLGAMNRVDASLLAKPVQ